uniref:Kazal-like domain-containing protein n=1 Tax=Calidris pygmaea TaxID=425635 RepID=A0A8C3KET4_9CHAR
GPCSGIFLLLLRLVTSDVLCDDCREFRDLFKKGKLSCTRENDPVRDSTGKQHSNKCIMLGGEISRVLGALLLSKHRSKCLRLI